MELTQGSETSDNYNLMPGKYPKEYIQDIILCLYSKSVSHLQIGQADDVMQGMF